MAADLVPIRLSLTDGDRYTVWAPRWRDAGDEWEAFLGKDEDLYTFETRADLVAFVRTNSDNDLVDHPAWQELTEANAHKLEPADDKHFDLVAVEELVSEKPTEESVATLANALTIVSSIGSVCELPAVMKFFNGNPTLGTLSGGIDHFTGKAGLKRWHAIADVVGRGWDDVLERRRRDRQHPRRGQRGAEAAEAELAEPFEDESTRRLETEPETADERRTRDRGRGRRRRRPRDRRRGGAGRRRGLLDEGRHRPDPDDDRRQHVLHLALLLRDRPIFLGRNGRISVFSSERALARYLADEHDHDLSDLSTYDDIRTAATDGSLHVDITDDNVYVLSGLADDFAGGPDAVDHEQLDLAVEFLRDLGEYSEDTTIDKALDIDQPLGKLVAYVLEPDSTSKPADPVRRRGPGMGRARAVCGHALTARVAHHEPGKFTSLVTDFHSSMDDDIAAILSRIAFKTSRPNSSRSGDRRVRSPSAPPRQPFWGRPAGGRRTV